ncbi:MAG: hypothetical protein ABR607_07575 [Pyrinomonadaceae bacterium]
MNKFQSASGIWLLFLALSLVTSCSKSSEGVGGAYPKAIGAADEGSAIQALRTIATGEAQAKATRGAYGDFDSLVQAGFLDQRFGGSEPSLRGYRFVMTASENEFSVTADPQTVQAGPAPGSRHFYLDGTDNAIHVNRSQSATKQDPLL